MSTITQISDTIAILGTIDAVDGATSAVTSDWVDVKQYPFIAAFITVGAVGGVLNAKLVEGNTSSGGTPLDLSGKAITAIGGSDDNQQFIINFDTSNMTSDAYRWVACIITPATGANLISCMILGAMARYAPVLGHDLGTVAEIINA